ncbi:FecR family protein, partial [bacterium]|nr:FecR family protein [bacterium]
QTRKRYVSVKTATAVIGVKGTDFVAEYKDKITLVGTVEGLVNLESVMTKANIDIAPGQMSSVSPTGELMPVSEFAGDLLEGVEFFGQKMESDDFSGEKIK